MNTAIPADQVVAVADEADVSLPSMTRYIAGLPMRPRIVARIERALAARQAAREPDSTPPPATTKRTRPKAA